MHSSKLLAQIQTNRKPAANGLKEASNIGAKKGESLCGIKIRTPKKRQQSRKQMETIILKQLQIAPINKIYNDSKSVKKVQFLNKSSIQHRSKIQQETETKIKKKEEFEARPLSSTCQKWKKTVQNILISNNGSHQLRPGSSKSSRLFKKKSCLNQDYIKSQNDQVEQPFIKVNTRQKDFKSSLRQRIGTSISKKVRGIDKIQGKLDPQFFNLFAS